MELADPSSALDSELDGLDATQDSVEDTSRKLCARYAKAPVVAQAWLDYFERKPDSTKRLACMYLASHMMQHRSYEVARSFRDAFGDVAAAAVKLLAKNADPSTRTKIEKLLSVWKQRKVVPPVVQAALDRALSGATSSSAGTGAGDDDGDDDGGGDGDGAYDGGDMAMGADDGSDLALIGADTRHPVVRAVEIVDRIDAYARKQERKLDAEVRAELTATATAGEAKAGAGDGSGGSGTAEGAGAGGGGEGEGNGGGAEAPAIDLKAPGLDVCKLMAETESATKMYEDQRVVLQSMMLAREQLIEALTVATEQQEAEVLKAKEASEAAASAMIALDQLEAAQRTPRWQQLSAVHRKRKAAALQAELEEREQELLRQREAQEEALAAKRARIEAAKAKQGADASDIHTEKKQVWDKELMQYVEITDGESWRDH